MTALCNWHGKNFFMKHMDTYKVCVGKARATQEKVLTTSNPDWRTPQAAWIADSSATLRNIYANID